MISIILYILLNLSYVPDVYIHIYNIVCLTLCVISNTSIQKCIGSSWPPASALILIGNTGEPHYSPIDRCYLVLCKRFPQLPAAGVCPRKGSTMSCACTTIVSSMTYIYSSKQVTRTKTYIRAMVLYMAKHPRNINSVVLYFRM